MHHIKNLIDFGGALTVLAALFDKLPQIAAGFAVLWYLIRFVEFIYSKIYHKYNGVDRRKSDDEPADM